MTEAELPPCGLYRTTREIAGIAAGRLVFFHNHGDPGPGLYLPERWKGNRAQFAQKGTTLPDPSDANALEALEPEGFYQVIEPFHCCDKKCRRFEEGLFVQLGYNGSATPIVFVPEFVEGSLALPERGTVVDRDRVSKLRRLKVAEQRNSRTQSEEPPQMLH
jgi:hypothetical protein